MPKYNAWIQKYKYKTHTQDFAPCTPCPPEGEYTYKILFRQDQETLKKNLFDKFFSGEKRKKEALRGKTQDQINQRQDQTQNPIDPDHLDHFSSTMKRINY